MADLDTAAKRHAGLDLYVRFPPLPSGSDADTTLERGQLVGVYGASVTAVVSLTDPYPRFGILDHQTYGVLEL